MSPWYPIAAFAAFSMAVGFVLARQEVNAWTLILFSVISIASLQIGYLIRLLVDLGKE